MARVSEVAWCAPVRPGEQLEEDEGCWAGDEEDQLVSQIELPRAFQALPEPQGVESAPRARDAQYSVLLLESSKGHQIDLDPVDEVSEVQVLGEDLEVWLEGPKELIDLGSALH